MSDMIADETFDHILRSLKENSAELAREERARRYAPWRRALFICLVFAAGIVIGAVLVTALKAAG